MLTYQQKKDILTVQLFQSQRLTSSEKLVALCMAYMIDDRGQVDMRMPQLAFMSRLHKRTIIRVLKSLAEKINLETNVEGRRNVYYFVQWRHLGQAPETFGGLSQSTCFKITGTRPVTFVYLLRSSLPLPHISPVRWK